jgi:hypothetical protein
MFLQAGQTLARHRAVSIRRAVWNFCHLPVATLLLVPWVYVPTIYAQGEDGKRFLDAVVAKRRALTSGVVVADSRTQSRKGAVEAHYEVIFDGDKMRLDFTNKSLQRSSCFGCMPLMHVEALSFDNHTTITIRDAHQTSRHEAPYTVPEVMYLGLFAVDLMHSATIRSDSIFTPATDVTVHHEALENVPCIKLSYTSLYGSLHEFWLVEEQPLAVKRARISGLEDPDEELIVDNELAYHEDIDLWFPKVVLQQQRRKGETVDGCVCRIQ